MDYTSNNEYCENNNTYKSEDESLDTSLYGAATISKTVPQQYQKRHSSAKHID